MRIIHNTKCEKVIFPQANYLITKKHFFVFFPKNIPEREKVECVVGRSLFIIFL